MISAFFWGLGLFFIFFGAVGLIILDDIFLRFHAATKCGVLGIVNVLIGLILVADSFEQGLKLFLVIVFVLITAPLTVHILCLSFYDESKV